MTTVAARRTFAGTAENTLLAFGLTALVAALVVLTPPLIARELARGADILDWTICAASPSSSGRPAAVPTITGYEPLAAEPHKRITSAIVEFPPNAFSPEHHHEADLYVYVLAGTIRSQLGGQAVETYSAGQSFFEPDGSVHLFAENASASEPARILAVFVHREGARLTVFH
jgi:quercetin dioxygenase-like cupin family protein